MPLLILFKYLENQMTYRRSYYYSDAPQLMTPPTYICSCNHNTDLLLQSQYI